MILNENLNAQCKMTAMRRFLLANQKSTLQPLCSIVRTNEPVLLVNQNHSALCSSIYKVMNLLRLFYIVNQTHALLKIMVVKGCFSETFLINNLKNLFFFII